MNPMIVDIVTALVRYALASIFAALLAKNVLTQEQVTWLTSAIALGLITVGAAVVRAAIRKRKKLVTAMAAPKPVSEREVEAMIEEKKAPPVTVPKSRAPHLEGEPNPMRELKTAEPDNRS